METVDTHEGRSGEELEETWMEELSTDPTLLEEMTTDNPGIHDCFAANETYIDFRVPIFYCDEDVETVDTQSGEVTEPQEES